MRVMTGEFGRALLDKLDELGYVGLGFGDFRSATLPIMCAPSRQWRDMKGLKILT